MLTTLLLMSHIKYMARAKVKKSETNLQFLFPSIVAGVVAFLFSMDLMLGIEVFVVVLIVSYIAKWVYKRK